ncbi:hypothetical protein Aeqsu_1757 [Aequorivita sublithincola DSM 14238]|uniref:Lipoprotein n=1 Tax=Aequorivita sublithincola (strain DSM 14238 / LMG 21431 / ACAM 643 / 9-3) TaxID=746697 RepID=I3YW69_AEQSU|nr:hypothetical protein [Aequorivita sublithincola]AFL81237.1 hypothetical protein Aeqsu_1757 [Aequorivita sublithincola DSM 14238]
MINYKIFKLVSFLYVSILLTSCSDGKLIENQGRCHSLLNKSNEIRSFTILNEYKNDISKTQIITLKPGEQVLLVCTGSTSSTITGSIKIDPSNYEQHKSMDSWPYGNSRLKRVHTN